MACESTAVYLYCLAQDESLVADLTRQGLPGIDERYPIACLAHEGLVAVMGEVVLSEFCAENLHSLEWLAPRACRHEQVVEMVMRASPVLPVKFGTVFQSRDQLAEFLRRHAPAISRGLKALRGKTEWTVKAYLGEAFARQRISAEDPLVSSRVAQLPSTPGARYLAQKRIDGLIDAELRVWTDRVKQSIFGALTAAASKATDLPLPGHEKDRGEMVFHLGFLVADAGMGDFCQQLEGQRRLYGERGLRLELRGPWPPHHFCSDLARTELV